MFWGILGPKMKLSQSRKPIFFTTGFSLSFSHAAKHG